MVKLEEPDKGRAWVVAIASSTITMILSGLIRVDGLIYVAILKTYGVSRQDATLPFTIRTAVRCLSGPVVGVFGQRYGVRAVSFWGGVIATIAVALCWFAPNIVWLTVFWGGIYGFGFAFANTLFTVVINQYFEKYRATASGIAISGPCIGSFLFSFITEHILDTFGLSGGFLILAGIVMHVLPPSLLLKSPLWVENPEEYAQLKALKMKDESLKTTERIVTDSFPEKVSKEEQCRQWSETKPSASLNNCPNDSIMFMEKSHASSIPTIYENLEKEKYNINTTGLTEVTTKVSPGNKTSLLESIRGISVLYTNPGYVLVDLSLAIYTIIIIPVLTVIIDYGEDKGILESYGIHIINSMSIGNLIGRLCFGWVTDKNFLTLPIFMAVAFTFQGVFIMLLPKVTDLYIFMFILALHGVTIGIILVLFPLLVLRYVDTRLQSVAMGCKEFLSGITTFAVPPMIGHFRDYIGSYDGMFYLLGVISVVTGGIWFLEPFLLKLHRGRTVENKSVKEEEMKIELPLKDSKCRNDF